MASLQVSNLLLSSNACSCSASSSSSSRISAAVSVPKLPNIRFSTSKPPVTRELVDRLKYYELKTAIPVEKSVSSRRIQEENDESSAVSTAVAQLYTLLEAVSDRVEMHKNVGEQRDNWNTLLLNSVNMITLTAATMSGVAATGGGSSHLALQLSSTLLFSAATGMMGIVNNIQPSQLAEEQRNAVRLFKQIQSSMQTLLAAGIVTEEDIKEIMEKVLALDKAYPLPLLGNKMIEKFPISFKPSVWWPSKKNSQRNNKVNGRVTKWSGKINGWNEELETEMREVMEVIKNKDAEDYNRLGSTVLKVNKILAFSGPLLTGIAAVGSGLAVTHQGSAAGAVGAAAGALATVINSLEHGGQMGMVVEMYKNCYGMFTQLEEMIESNLNESDIEKRENGELFEMKVALKLGRSVSELRDLAINSGYSRLIGDELEEFSSKLF